MKTSLFIRRLKSKQNSYVKFRTMPSHHVPRHTDLCYATSGPGQPCAPVMGNSGYIRLDGQNQDCVDSYFIIRGSFRRNGLATPIVAAVLRIFHTK